MKCRSPYPKRVFASRMEENAAIDALLPLLNTRRQQLLVINPSSIDSFKDQTATIREFERRRRIEFEQRLKSVIQHDRVFIDQSER